MPRKNKRAVALRDEFLEQLVQEVTRTGEESNDLAITTAYDAFLRSRSRPPEDYSNQLGADLNEARTQNDGTLSPAQPRDKVIQKRVKALISAHSEIYDAFTSREEGVMLGDPMEVDHEEPDMNINLEESDLKEIVRQFLFEDEAEERLQKTNDQHGLFRISLIPPIVHKRSPAIELDTLPRFVEGFKPHPWQLQGAGVARQMCGSSFGGACIADPMGYGKTLTTIMTAMRPKGMPYQGPVLIIVPKTLVPHWEEQFSCFEQVDRPSVFVLTNRNMTARELAEIRADFVIITPQYLSARYLEWQDATQQARFGLHVLGRPVARRQTSSRFRQTNCVFDIECWTSLGLHFPFAIFDEVHGAKNPDAITNRASAALDARAKLLVSGTPMKNKVFDAFGILKILPGCPFATEKAFLRVLSINPKARGPPKLHLRRLAQILDACTIVRPHEALNLPGLVEHTVKAELLDETVLDIAMVAHQFHRLAVISGGGRRRRPQNTGHGAALSYATRARLMATSPIFNRPSPSQEKDMRSTRERFREWCTEKGHDMLTIARNPDLLREFAQSVQKKNRDEREEDPDWDPEVGDVDEDDEVIGPDDANLNDNPRRVRNRQLWLSHLDTEWVNEVDRLMDDKSPRLQAIQEVIEQIEEVEIDESSNDVDPDVKIVIFSEWVHELDLIEKFLDWQYDGCYKVLRFDVMESHILDKAEVKDAEVEEVMSLLTRPDGADPIVTWSESEIHAIASALGL
ncbi:hypothetical protein K4K56_004419 [Colletotrichum sp. SAR 10_98]|nr:hypothetical protein K4K56_004419 [Colletotrichum sp. SAR 10_98]